MPLLNSNRINKTLTGKELDAISASLTQLEKSLEFTVGLTPDERKSIPKMSDSNKTFTGDAMRAAEQTAEILPAFMKLDDMRADISLYDQLDSISLRLGKLLERVTDTQTLAGSEAYVSALTVYRLTEAASNAGLGGATEVYSRLKERFSGQGLPGAVKPAPVVPAE